MKSPKCGGSGACLSKRSLSGPCITIRKLRRFGSEALPWGEGLAMDSRPQIRLRTRAGTGLAMFMRRKGFNPTQGATGKVATHPARAASGNALSPEAARDRRHRPAPDRERSGRPKVALPMRQPWCRWYGRPALPLHKDSALASAGFRSIDSGTVSGAVGFRHGGLTLHRADAYAVPTFREKANACPTSSCRSGHRGRSGGKGFEGRAHARMPRAVQAVTARDETSYRDRTI